MDEQGARAVVLAAYVAVLPQLDGKPLAACAMLQGGGTDALCDVKQYDL